MKIHSALSNLEGSLILYKCVNGRRSQRSMSSRVFIMLWNCLCERCAEYKENAHDVSIDRIRATPWPLHSHSNGNHLQPQFPFQFGSLPCERTWAEDAPTTSSPVLPDNYPSSRVGHLASRPLAPNTFSEGYEQEWRSTAIHAAEYDQRFEHNWKRSVSREFRSHT